MAKYLPLEVILASHTFPFCNAATAGAIFRILLFWYRAGCREITRAEIMNASALRQNDYFRNEKHINQILLEITPELQQAAMKEDKRQTKMAQVARNAQKIFVEQRRIKKANNSKDYELSDENKGNAGKEFTPIFSPKPFKEGFSDRKTADFGRKATLKRDETLFLDD